MVGRKFLLAFIAFFLSILVSACLSTGVYSTSTELILKPRKKWELQIVMILPDEASIYMHDFEATLNEDFSKLCSHISIV